MNISKYISDHNSDYQKKTLMRKIGLGLYLSPFVLSLILMFAALFINKEGALAPFITYLGFLFIILPIIGLIFRVYSNKKYKNSRIIDKYIIHSFISNTPSQLYEEAGVKIKDGEYYYYTLSLYYKMSAGGNSAKVPDEFVTGQDVNIEGLLTYISKEEPYMKSLQHENAKEPLVKTCRCARCKKRNFFR